MCVCSGHIVIWTQSCAPSTQTCVNLILRMMAATSHGPVVRFKLCHGLKKFHNFMIYFMITTCRLAGLVRVPNILDVIYKWYRLCSVKKLVCFLPRHFQLRPFSCNHYIVKLWYVGLTPPESHPGPRLATTHSWQIAFIKLTVLINSGCCKEVKYHITLNIALHAAVNSNAVHARLSFKDS